MDFPTSKAAALRLSGGRYIDRNEATSTPGSIVTAADFINPMFDELLAVLTEAGIAPNEATYTQVRDAILAIIAANPSVPRGFIDGLTLSNNGATPATHIDIAPGIARSAGDQYNMVLAAALTKNLNAAWAVGGGNGGLFSGAALAASTWYHVHLIRQDSDGAIDAGADTSVIAANRPAGWSAYRRIGAVLTDGAGSIVGFYQRGETFFWQTPVTDVNIANGTTARSLQTLSIPQGLKVRPLFAFYVNNNASTEHAVIITDPDETDVPPTTSLFSVDNVDDNNRDDTIWPYVWSNASSQVGFRANNLTAAWKVNTFGWIDTRGRNA